MVSRPGSAVGARRVAPNAIPPTEALASTVDFRRGYHRYATNWMYICTSNVCFMYHVYDCLWLFHTNTVQGVHTLLLHCYGLCKERWTYNDTLLDCCNDSLLDCWFSDVRILCNPSDVHPFMASPIWSSTQRPLCVLCRPPRHPQVVRPLGVRGHPSATWCMWILCHVYPWQRSIHRQLLRWRKT